MRLSNNNIIIIFCPHTYSLDNVYSVYSLDNVKRDEVFFSHYYFQRVNVFYKYSVLRFARRMNGARRSRWPATAPHRESYVHGQTHGATTVKMDDFDE